MPPLVYKELEASKWEVNGTSTHCGTFLGSSPALAIMPRAFCRGLVPLSRALDKAKPLKPGFRVGVETQRQGRA